MSGVCRKGIVVVDRCSRCGGNLRCVRHTKCVGGTCKSLGRSGDKCGRWWCGGCVRGLKCVSNVCRQPTVLVNRCSQCGGSRQCAKGTTCIGGTCTSTGRTGDKCSKACGTCGAGLECGAEGICEASLDDFFY